MYLSEEENNKKDNKDNSEKKERTQREGLEGNRHRVKSLSEFYTKKGMLEGILGPRFNEEKNENKKENKNKIVETDENIYIPKCLMIMSLYPYFAEYEKILTEIYNYSLIVDEEAELTKKQ